MNILITGITGLIGRHIAEKLVKEKNHSIKGHCFSSNNLSFFIENRIEIFKADICDKVALAGICSGCDTVIHSAARVIDYGTKEQFYEAHVEATRYLLEEAVKSNVSHFIYISSMGPATYISRENGILPDEKIPLVNSGIDYDDAKIDAEELVKAYAQKHNFYFTIVRPSAVIGPDSVWVREPLLRVHQSPIGVILINEGKYSACLLDAENLADGLYRILTMPVARNQTYYFMDDWNISWKEYLTDLLQFIGEKPGISLPKSLMLFLARFLSFILLPFEKKPPFGVKAIMALGSDRRVNTEKARTELGWTSKITYQMSMKKINNWIDSRPDLFKSKASKHYK